MKKSTREQIADGGGLKKSEPDAIEWLIISWRATAEKLRGDERGDIFELCANELERAYIGPDPAGEESA